MPEETQPTSLDDSRLVELYTTVTKFPTLGAIGPEDFTTLSHEYVYMKLYAMRLETLLVEVITALKECIPADKLPTVPEPAHTHATEEKQPE